MTDAKEWKSLLDELLDKANDTELSSIARLAAATVRIKASDDITDRLDEKLRELGAGEVLRQIVLSASEREIRMIARLAAAVIGKKTRKQARDVDNLQVK